MNKIQLVVGSYNHLPPGTAETAFETAYQRNYRPFLSVLYRFPELQAALHYSGSLLSWLEARHPEFLMLLAEMTGRKQVELIGGAAFEPILPLVPGTDRIGQIEHLTVFIRKNFGRRPHGCWLAAYAWEPSLAGALRTSGMDYAFLLERSFRAAGIAADQVDGPVATEDQGRDVAIFPVHDCACSFDRLLGFDEALAAIRARGPAPAFAAVFMPGEAAEALWLRSGLESPDVWFEREFSSLSRNAAIETALPGRALRARRHLRRAYFPSSASDVFLDACSPPALARDYAELRARLGPGAEPPPREGGVRQAILRTEEAAALYAKMQYVHLLVSQLRGDKSRKKTAQEELWSGQCGDAYWPGEGGGIASAGIRGAAYRSLIEAEKITRQKATFVPGIIQADVDYDREKEILYQGLAYNAYIHARGAAIFELDGIRDARNLASGYGGDPEGTSSLRRRCFVDAATTVPVEPADLARGAIPDLSGFGSAWYGRLDAKKPAHEVAFSCEAALASGDGSARLGVEKGYSFKRNQFVVHWVLANRSTGPLEFRFQTFLHLSLADRPGTCEVSAWRREADGAESELRLGPEAQAALPDVARVAIADPRIEDGVTISADRPFRLVSTPYRGGTALAEWQGQALGLEWAIRLEPGAEWKVMATLSFRDERPAEPAPR